MSAMLGDAAGEFKILRPVRTQYSPISSGTDHTKFGIPVYAGSTDPATGRKGLPTVRKRLSGTHQILRPVRRQLVLTVPSKVAFPLIVAYNSLNFGSPSWSVRGIDESLPTLQEDLHGR